MPSAAKEKRLAKKAADGKGKGKAGKNKEPELDANGNPIVDDSPATTGEKLEEADGQARYL